MFSELNLSHNKMSKLPDELQDCTELEKLDISHNSFVFLPPVLYKLPKIKTIIASHNFIMGKYILFFKLHFEWN